MASYEASSGRKKRAWRQPREPATPEREGASSVPAQKPVKLQRTSKHQATPLQPTDSTPRSRDPVKEIEHGKELTPQKAKPQKAKDHEMVGHHSEPEINGQTAGGAVRGVAVGVSNGQGAPLEIDGSVMEGVSSR